MSDDLAQYPSKLLAAAERLDHICDSELAGWDGQRPMTARLSAAYYLLSAAESSDLLKMDSSDPGVMSPWSLDNDAGTLMHEYKVAHGEPHPARDEWLSAWATYEAQVTYCLLDLLCGARDYGLTDRLAAAFTSASNREHS